MKHKLLLLFMVVALMMTLCLTVNAMEGSGSETDPYIIKTAEDFMSINNDLSKHYKLDADLELTSDGDAIVAVDDHNIFSGVFDGNAHTIDISVVGATDGTHTYDSLFGVVSGKIKNLTVTGNATGSDKVAGIAGKIVSSANVDSCVNYATITGRKNIGGIVGLIVDNATVTNCINYGSINGTSPISKGLDMGGIVGCIWNEGRNIVVVSNCYNAGEIYGQGYNVGGICGHSNGGILENCFNSGEITATANKGSEGAFIGQIADTWNGYKINGYFSTTDDDEVGVTKGTTFALSNPLIESTGVSIYLGKGSGIRGEFHINKDTLDAFSKLLGEIEYGTVVSTKDVVASVNGDLLSSEAKESGKIVFAPAMKDGEEQYSYVDPSKGEDYHSFRFALTGFPDDKISYNTEFVILGYLLFKDNNGENHFDFVNTVVSSRLASAVKETGINAVSIVRVAEASIEDGDFEGNDTALEQLNHIANLKDYATKIEIDGVVGYGHKSATFTMNYSSDDTVVFKISNSDATEFDVYINSLVYSNYEKISENVINNNRFYTFKNGNTLINAVYTVSDGKVTITKETITALPENITKPTFEKVTDPSITQIKLEASIPEGMSYVIQLSDGTFLIIDGGWCDSNEKEADKLYNTLAELTGEGNDIVIAGWIFTHCHGDHIGTFNFFAQKYHDSVTIKQLLYNFPSDEDISGSNSSYMLDDTKQRYVNFKYVIATYLQDTEIVKVHSGYKFYYADAEIEILQTLEDLYPSTVADYDFNSSSTIFTVTVGGQKMLFLGDVSDVGASRLNSVYGTSLKSDFLQIAHHGINNNGTIKALYVNADATYILYPAPLTWFNNNSNTSANFFLQTESKTVKQIFVSGAQTMELYLPYDGKLYEGVKLPGITVESDDSDRVEAERPTESVEVTAPYFDLDLSSGTATDSAGNATITVTGGEITETTVSHSGTQATTNTFTGDRYKEQYYMTLNFNEITSDEEWGNFVMGSSTFEVFLRLDNIPTGTVGIFTSCNGGGVTIYIRRSGKQINFQIGSTQANSFTDSNTKYSATVEMDADGPAPKAGELLHIVGSYDSKTNMMKLYVNGILISQASYGEGSFRGGSQNDYVLGIGYNPQYGGEEISKYANYELFEARIYDYALSDAQVAHQYWNCIDNLFEGGAE